MSIILNEDQSSAVANMVEFFKSPTERYFVLEGFGGTGKTTCINTLVEQLQSMYANPLNICMTAPTNKATKVLMSMGYEYSLKGVHYKTIYSLLGLVVTNTQEIKYATKMVDGNFEDYDLVVVDETSMINKFVFGVIEDHLAKSSKTKVIFMGDKAQLPPVKENNSTVFSLDCRRSKLNQIMRQVESNPIRDVTQSIRDAQSDPRVSEIAYNTAVNPTTKQGVYVLNAKDWMGYIKENFASDEYKDDPNSFRVLAYTNRRVRFVNNVIRNLLVGKTESPFIVGERVIVTSPIEDDLTGDKIHTDEECEVIDVFESTHPYHDGQFKVWQTDLRSDSNVFTTAFLLHDDSRADYNKTCDALANKAKQSGRGSDWAEFYNFKDSFHSLYPPHALTVHRSQGSTYKNVFVDMRDIYCNKKRLERLQLEYVATSRASETLIILK